MPQTNGNTLIDRRILEIVTLNVFFSQNFAAIGLQLEPAHGNHGKMDRQIGGMEGK